MDTAQAASGRPPVGWPGFCKIVAHGSIQRSRFHLFARRRSRARGWRLYRRRLVRRSQATCPARAGAAVGDFAGQIGLSRRRYRLGCVKGARRRTICLTTRQRPPLTLTLRTGTERKAPESAIADSHQRSAPNISCPPPGRVTRSAMPPCAEAKALHAKP